MLTTSSICCSFQVSRRLEGGDRLQQAGIDARPSQFPEHGGDHRGELREVGSDRLVIYRERQHDLLNCVDRLSVCALYP